MGRGHRARHEFIAQERATPPERTPEQVPALLSSELRVVRWADTSPSLDTDDWYTFMNDVGRRNYGIGRAHALGSVAITLVPAKEMGRMLSEKYPDAYRDPQRIQRLHKRVREGINGFVQDSIRANFDGRTREMESAYTIGSRDMLAGGFSNDLDDYVESLPTLRAESPARLMASNAILEERVLPLAGVPTPFNAGTFKSPRIGLYGPGYAIDLSDNEVLAVERREMLHYLREGEGLKTWNLERDGWEPHATIFSFEDHIRGASLGYRVGIPEVMGFEAVQAVIPPRATTVYR